MTKSIQNKLEHYNQMHLLRYENTLNEADAKKLTKQISDIDWSFMDTFYKKDAKRSGTLAPMSACTIDRINEHYDEYKKVGLNAIKDGKLALLLLAGGQGTRLGHNSPKGTFNMGETHNLYIFQLLIEHTLDVVSEAGSFIHMYIMTSNINHDDTVDFFKKHNYFGYNPDYIHFFVQELNPATDFDGKILMSSKSDLALSPNGNGGWFSSMAKAGLLEEIESSPIEWINVFAVDNVLQRIADPVFFGATLLSGKGSGAKVVRKAAPGEKVGVMCYEDGKPHIVEYYELTDAMLTQKNADGSLAYGFGVILNYLFPVKSLKNTLGKHMPLHMVKKAVPYIDESGTLITPDAPNAYKYETLALDLIHEMDDCLVFEIDRNKEFAPVKNRTGIDSVDTARELLKRNGYEL
jgi:UDP-N-acetylglucosamine/UDP-N-acetylgalactosamine diphosphorylase